MTQCYQYTADGYYAGESDDYGLLPSNATYTAPPAGPWGRMWPRWTGTAWELVEDHRERKTPYFPKEEDWQEATEFWLSEDDFKSSPRAMKEPGPLPEGAQLTRPEKPLSVAQDDKRREIVTAHGQVLAYLIVDSPEASSVEAALAVEDMRSDDPEGLAYVRGLADARRSELLAAVNAAQSVPAVEAIAVSYPV